MITTEEAKRRITREETEATAKQILRDAIDWIDGVCDKPETNNWGIRIKCRICGHEFELEKGCHLLAGGVSTSKGHIIGTCNFGNPVKSGRKIHTAEELRESWNHPETWKT
jgi:hypothetical protein